MNTQYFVYALEVEKTGSITQAANNLYMSQPTLSKAIKDLEVSLGFSVFHRTPKGMIPTQKGEEFLNHARKIAAQLKKMEMALHVRGESDQLFSLAIPRVSYIAQAASEFIASLDGDREMEIDVLETSSIKVMEAVAHDHYVLGVIRYHLEDEEFFLKSLEENGLQYEIVWQSDYQLLMREDHPLAGEKQLTGADLEAYIEVRFSDDEVPYIRVSESVSRPELPGSSRRILINNRAMQLEVLKNNPLAYMWVSPLPSDILQKNQLVQCKCRTSCQFRDILISRAGYKFSRLDRAFIDKLYLQKNNVAYGD